MLFLLILFVLAYSLDSNDYDFKKESLVKNVRYTKFDTYPCEVLLDSGFNRWYSSKSVRMCEFADKCKTERKQVKLYYKDQRDIEEVIAIEYLI